MRAGWGTARDGHAARGSILHGSGVQQARRAMGGSSVAGEVRIAGRSKLCRRKRQGRVWCTASERMDARMEALSLKKTCVSNDNKKINVG